MPPKRNTPAPAVRAEPSLSHEGSLLPDSQRVQLELEKARLEVEQQRRALAFQDERHRKALTHDDDLHQRQVAQLSAESRDRSSNSQLHPDDDEEGEISPEAKTIALTYPAIRSR